VYSLLNKNCQALQEERIGGAKRKLYFLPAGLAVSGKEYVNLPVDGVLDDI